MDTSYFINDLCDVFVAAAAGGIITGEAITRLSAALTDKNQP